MRGHSSGSSIELEDESARIFGHLLFLRLLNKQINKEDALLDGKIDPNYKGKTVLLIHCEDMKDYVFNPGYS